jgi:hypothetical protein
LLGILIENIYEIKLNYFKRLISVKKLENHKNCINSKKQCTRIGVDLIQRQHNQHIPVLRFPTLREQIQIKVGHSVQTKRLLL